MTCISESVRDIPMELLSYQDRTYKAYSSGPPNWVVVQEATGAIKAMRSPLFPKEAIYITVLVGILISSLFYAVGFLPLDDGARRVYRIVFPLIAALTIILMPFAHAAMVYINSLNWNTVERFIYDVNPNRLIFPNEDKSYCKNDLLRTLLCCVWGRDTQGNVEGGPAAHGLSIAPRAQCFILVQTPDNQWHRHDIGLDLVRYGSKTGTPPFDKLVTLLQPLLNCEVFFKKG